MLMRSITCIVKLWDKKNINFLFGSNQGSRVQIRSGFINKSGISLLVSHKNLSLTYSYLETCKRVIGKQCRPSSDATSYAT